MAKVMLPTGRIIERKPDFGRGVVKIRFRGRKVVVTQVYNVLFDFIVIGFNRDMEFWNVNEGVQARVD
jgi:hypothetical protein